MSWYKNLMYAAIGAGTLWLAQISYDAIAGPDLVYKHRHFDNPAEHGRVRIEIEGAKFSRYNFLGGQEEPQTAEAMLDGASKRLKSWELLKQVGIDPKQGISELEVRIKK